MQAGLWRLAAADKALFPNHLNKRHISAVCLIAKLMHQ